MKAKVDGVSKNAQKPMKQFSVEEVQNWFKTFDKGFFKKYAKNFKSLDGKRMMELSEKQMKEIAKDVANGIAIYNELHKKVKGIFFPQLFADFFYVSYFLVFV